MGTEIYRGIKFGLIYGAPLVASFCIFTLYIQENEMTIDKDSPYKEIENRVKELLSAIKKADAGEASDFDIFSAIKETEYAYRDLIEQED